MSKRPAAHNPMIFRKVTKPAGRVCDVPGCGGYIREGEPGCAVCAFNQALAELEASKEKP